MYQWHESRFEMALRETSECDGLFLEYIYNSHDEATGIKYGLGVTTKMSKLPCWATNHRKSGCWTTTTVRPPSPYRNPGT